MKNFIYLGMTGLLASLAAISITGCSSGTEDENDVVLMPALENPLDFVQRMSSDLAETNALKLADMKEDDVIVAINRFPLTKQAFEEMMHLREEGLKKDPNVPTMAIDKIMDQARRKYIETFVGQRLLIDNAQELNIVTNDEIKKHVSARLVAAAKSKNCSVTQLIAQYGSGAKYFIYEIAASYTMDKLIKEKIPPKLQVNDKFVDAVQQQVRIENEAAQATNKIVKARLEGWKHQILEQNLDFGQLSDMFSTRDDDTTFVGENGYWGEFHPGDFDSPEMDEAIFNLQQDEISDVLEDDNGYHIVKVTNIVPEERNEKGRLISSEVRTLSHIYVAKVPLIEKQTDVSMTADLKNQMQLWAINEYATNLMTNGTSSVVFPHGRELF